MGRWRLRKYFTDFDNTISRFFFKLKKLKIMFLVTFTIIARYTRYARIISISLVFFKQVLFLFLCSLFIKTLCGKGERSFTICIWSWSGSESCGIYSTTRSSSYSEWFLLGGVARHDTFWRFMSTIPRRWL